MEEGSSSLVRPASYGPGRRDPGQGCSRHRRRLPLLGPLPLVLALCLLLAGWSRGPAGAQAFNMLPKLPSFRHHLFFHPATPAPAPPEGGPGTTPTARSTTNLSPSGDNSGSAGGEEHPLHAGAGTLVDVARRRFWRWTVWRRLYHSSVVTVLKQAAPPSLPSFAPRRPRLGACVRVR